MYFGAVNGNLCSYVLKRLLRFAFRLKSQFILCFIIFWILDVTPDTHEFSLLFIQMKSKVQDKAKAQFDDYSPVDFISTNEHGVNYIYVVKVIVLFNVEFLIFFYVSSDLHLHCLIVLKHNHSTKCHPHLHVIKYFVAAL